MQMARLASTRTAAIKTTCARPGRSKVMVVGSLAGKCSTCLDGRSKPYRIILDRCLPGAGPKVVKRLIPAYATPALYYSIYALSFRFLMD